MSSFEATMSSVYSEQTSESVQTPKLEDTSKPDANSVAEHEEYEEYEEYSNSVSGSDLELADQMDQVEEMFNEDQNLQCEYCQAYEDSHPDTWFPDFRNEPCCHGYINICSVNHRARVA